MKLESRLFSCALGLAALAIPQAQAQTFNVIYNFTGGNDGGIPLAGLVIDTAGNLYGTTSTGGSSGGGTVFKVSASGQETVLYNFTGGSDGGNPQASLLRTSAGKIYGTTSAGGAHGYGAVFEVGENGGHEKVVYSFTGGADGANPESSLIIDSAGKLYGTTFAGGAYGGGTVFAVTQSGQETVLHSFGQGTDGANPVAAVTFGPSGKELFGTTSVGGTDGDGTVFQLAQSKAGWKETVIYNFTLQSDGGNPYAGVIFDASGNLYGAATNGGAGGSNGGGTVFEMSHPSGKWEFTLLYALPGWGISGSFRDLLMDASGNIWATTHCDGIYSNGTVYELTPGATPWTYTSLYVFPASGSDGFYVFSNLVFDKSGNLYGTASVGGEYGSGVVFKVTP
jgi:uncharacterized repeat protein (TIGR03803 family)